MKHRKSLKTKEKKNPVYVDYQKGKYYPKYFPSSFSLELQTEL